MTRSDVTVSGRPQAADGEITGGGASISRWVAVVAVVLAVVLAPAAAIAASEPTSGYEQKPTTPTSTVAPSKEKTTPTETAPTATTAPEKATTLPFTGFDLRWDVGLGVLLILAGVSIVVLQRRQRRHGQR